MGWLSIGNSTNTNFLLTDLRQSRQSLVSHNAFDGRQSRASKRSIHRQQMSRSRSRDRLTSGGTGYLGDPRDDHDSLGTVTNNISKI